MKFLYFGFDLMTIEWKECINDENVIEVAEMDKYMGHSSEKECCDFLFCIVS